MKKFMWGVAIMSAILFNSCKKDYVCDCKRIYTGNGGGLAQDDGSYRFSAPKSRAEARCKSQEATGTDIINGDYSRECEIREP